MATFKAEVYLHQKRRDGTYNIKIRVIHKQAKRYLSTPFYLTADDITRSGKIKNQRYIDLCDAEIKRYRKICETVGFRINEMTVGQIIDLIKKGSADDRFDLNFVEFGKEYIKNLRNNKRDGNASIYETALNNLIKFVGRETISIHEINSAFVKDWINWILTQPSLHKRKKGTRAASLYPSTIRALHNAAKNKYNEEDTGIIRIPMSPFKKIKLSQPHVKTERALDVETLRKIADIEYTQSYCRGVNTFNFAKDLFLLSFALVGMNAIDLFNCENIKDNRITYYRTKTRNRRADKALISIKIEPEIMPLIEKYIDKRGRRVFKFYQMYKNTHTFEQAINRALKKIGKIAGVDNLQFYAARHTWATIAANDAGVDKYTVHTALNHAVSEMKVTDLYIKTEWSVIDRANRAVLDYVKIF